MIHEHDIFRMRVVVDNTQRRQIPLPVPWYERPAYFVFLACGALAFCWLVVLVALAFE